MTEPGVEQNNQDQNDIQNPNKISRSSKLVILVVAAVMVIAIISVAVNGIYQKTGFRGIYNRAADLAIQMETEEAEALFRSIEDKHYKDTDAFLAFCEAVNYMETGDITNARKQLEEMKFEYTTDEQNAVIDAFKESLS